MLGKPHLLLRLGQLYYTFTVHTGASCIIHTEHHCHTLSCYEPNLLRPVLLMFYYVIMGPLQGKKKSSTVETSQRPRGTQCCTTSTRITESQNGRGWKGPLWVI